MSRRHHLSALDTEEFASLVRFKLIERDFAILRKFQQRSSLTTYLTVVIERLCLDFCIAKWGKWRPSAAARRLGSVAMTLERLIVREGITFDEAVGTLQTNHGVSETREELHAILLQLPRRWNRETLEALGAMATAGRSDPGLTQHEDERVVSRLHGALAAAYASLDADEQRIVSLRFGQGLAIVDIARVLGLESKVLYRRLGRILRVLRAELQRQGIHEAEIGQVVGHPQLAVTGVIRDRARR